MADLDTASAKADFNLYEDFVRFKQNITAQLESFTEQQNAARATPVEIQDLESRVAEIENKIASRDEIFKDLVSVVSAQEKALSEIEKKTDPEDGISTKPCRYAGILLEYGKIGISDLTMR